MFLKHTISLLLCIISCIAAESGYEGQTIFNEKYGKSLDDVHSIRSRDLFSDYLRFDEINAYLDQLAKNFSNRVFVQTVGKSYEGRDIKTITITNGDGRPNKKVIFVDAGIHGREWITPATAIYVINQLVEHFSTNAQLLNDYDWVVLPSINPDGYEYSRNHDDLWRKTRKPNKYGCIGTDLNRNFDFHWGESGASSNPCDESYMGDTPFSDPESIIVRDIMHSLSGRAKMYLSIHSFAKSFLYPWGYKAGKPTNWKYLHEVAQSGADAIKAATGTEYFVGSTPERLSLVSGGSRDYAFGPVQIPISFTMEMPRGYRSGFHPDPSEILNLASEAWIGIKAMAEKVIELYK